MFSLTVLERGEAASRNNKRLRPPLRGQVFLLEGGLRKKLLSG